jgi:glycosyltransferase involved in cell wall biosynthesis
VILLSQSQRAFFDGVLPAACINVIPHGVDVARFIPAPRAASDNRQFRCLVTGSYLRDWRIVRALPRLLSDMPAIAFDVVSASPDIESCSRITVHRTISDDALLALYRRAHLLVLPLTDAAANNALVEGMACGLPCVATDLPSIGEYAGDAAQLVPHHADAFAHAIRQLAADPVTRAVMGNAARRRAERLAWPLVALQHVDVYRHVLRRH